MKNIKYKKNDILFTEAQNLHLEFKRPGKGLRIKKQEN